MKSTDTNHIVVKATIWQTVVMVLVFLGTTFAVYMKFHDEFRDVKRTADEAVPLSAHTRWVAETEHMNVGRTQTWIGADMNLFVERKN